MPMGAPEPMEENPAFWTVPVFVRNGNELPVRIDAMDVAVQPWGTDTCWQPEKAPSRLEHYVDKVLRDRYQIDFAPGTIGPGDTWAHGLRVCRWVTRLTGRSRR